MTDKEKSVFPYCSIRAIGEYLSMRLETGETLRLSEDNDTELSTNKENRHSYENVHISA